VCNSWESGKEGLGNIGISFNIWEERSLSDTHKGVKHALMDEDLLTERVNFSIWPLGILVDWEVFVDGGVLSIVEKTIEIDLDEVF
tara:strand:+ start:552 stop:809 length:258 start_codon:yes stop_codon:yes gene_type:complete